jgi:ABC-2 type transport system ATP-binding protein
MSGTETVIDVAALTKSFGRVQALKGLDLQVVRGEVHGFLGPNGSGKSTTIRVLLGLLKADGGTVRLLDKDPWRDVVELHRRLAYVPGDVSLWRRAELVERFELDPTKRGRQYSKGNKQKVAVVAALASDVELLVLDEPTSGLDPLMENVFQKVIGEAKLRGVTVLLSSHILAELETLADRLSIIRDGVIVQSGTLGDLRGQTSTTIHAVLDRVLGQHELAGFTDLCSEGNRLSATVDSSRIGEAMALLTAHGIKSLTVAPPSLESLFLRLYGDDAEDGAIR